MSHDPDPPTLAFLKKRKQGNPKESKGFSLCGTPKSLEKKGKTQKQKTKKQENQKKKKAKSKEIKQGLDCVSELSNILPVAIKEPSLRLAIGVEGVRCAHCSGHDRNLYKLLTTPVFEDHQRALSASPALARGLVSNSLPGLSGVIRANRKFE